MSLSSLSARLAEVPYARFLGIRLEALADGALVLRLPYRDAHANRNRTVHGGVTASLIDVAARLMATAGDAAPAPGRLLDLSLRYLAPAAGVDLVAEARLVRRGAAIAVVDVEVSADGGVIATGLATHHGADRAGPSLDRPPAALASLDALDRPVPSGSPFTHRLGISTAWIAPGHAISLLPFRSDLTEADGRLHEGALASVCDSASGGASWSLHGFEVGGRASTVGMHLSFHGPAIGEDVLAESRVVGQDGRVFQNALTLCGRNRRGTVGTGFVTYRITRGES